MAGDPRQPPQPSPESAHIGDKPETARSILWSTDDHPDEELEDVDLPLPVVDHPLTVPLSTNVSHPVPAADHELISRILVPSPFPHHHAGPTSARFRNALNRVQTQPTADVEAWQALLTETQTCYKQIVANNNNTLTNSVTHPYTTDAETDVVARVKQQQLDWVESCYGAVLRYFPYASSHVHTVAEILWTLSSHGVAEEQQLLVFDGTNHSHHSTINASSVSPQRTQLYEAKLERLLSRYLGVTFDHSSSGSNYPNGRDADTPPSPPENTALPGMCDWMVELWLLYARKKRRDALRHSNLAQQQQQLPDARVSYVRDQTLQAYEQAQPFVGHGENNVIFWKAYLDFVRSWTAMANEDAKNHHAVAQQQMVRLRTIYQALIKYPMTGLDQLWQEYEAFERGQNETLAQALTQELLPTYQHARTVYLERHRVYDTNDLQLGRLATPPADNAVTQEEDYETKRAEEQALLRAWKVRVAYERTNPERLNSSEFARRVRQVYQAMVSVLTRYPEAWHMWSTWELSVATGTTTTSDVTADGRHHESTITLARAVLQLGQSHIPDCTLLAHTEAILVELHAVDPKSCLNVMERFVDRSPNTLGFVLYQQLTRRYQGMEAARKVFARARRVLVNPAEAAAAAAKQDVRTEDGVDAENHPHDEGSGGKRWVVTNRLDPNIGPTNGQQVQGATETTTGQEWVVDGSEKHPPGVITWHLYASHANIEHRVNKAPEVAARIYELGLRKHAAFLTVPSYVMRYAQLLLELNDTMNLRALLTRAVAACEAQEKENSLALLWNMTLHFESVMGGSDPTIAVTMQKIERQRRAALMGANVEEVATGGFVGINEPALIGAQKSTIADQLVRTESYDTSSSIVNGMNRAVDVLEIMGLWGSGESSVDQARRRIKQSKNRESEVDISGGKSDTSFQKRLEYQNAVSAGFSPEAGTTDGTAIGNKIMSARERYQQGAIAVASGGAVGSSAIIMAIQQMPDWLRPLLMTLPATRLRVPVVPKPPPHMVEIALAALKANSLPAERPEGEVSTSGSKRKLAAIDSSDEESDVQGGGYGSQFRNRQRARMNAS